MLLLARVLWTVSGETNLSPLVVCPWGVPGVLEGMWSFEAIGGLAGPWDLHWVLEEMWSFEAIGGWACLAGHCI